MLGLAVLLAGAVPDIFAQAARQAPPSAAGTVIPPTADYIVAVVNSEPITNHEVQARLERVEGQLRQQGARPA
jgi:peptidyl-prolyl cis-trans isomerase SurA